jgi:hypothetical protein
VGDQAVADVDDRVRAVRPEPGRSVRAHGELDPGPPAEAVAVIEWLDGDLAVDARQPAQLLADDRCLERALRAQARVLPVAAAAAAGAGVRAGRLDPVRRRPHDVHRIRARELGRDLGHPGADPLTGQRVPHEHHRHPRWSRDAPASLRDVADIYLDELARLEAHRWVPP